MIRGYRRRRGWQAWHHAVLPRVEEVPALHILMDEEEPPRDPAEEAERRLENLRAWKAALDAQAGAAAPATMPPETGEPAQ